MGRRRLEMMQRRLDLTDEQVATLRGKFAEHRAQGLTIVRDVLTDEQRAKFDRHLERRQSRRGGHGRGHHGHRHGSDVGTTVSTDTTDTTDTNVAGTPEVPTDAA